MDYEVESKAHKAENDYRNATVPTFGPRRLRNKTKAERSGPRKRRRKKKKNVKKVLDGNTQKRLSRDNKAGETRNFDVKNQIDGRSESKAKKRSIHEPRIGELGGDESVRRTKSDDMNAFTLFSFYSQLVGPPTPKYVHDTLQKKSSKNLAYVDDDKGRKQITRGRVPRTKNHVDLDGQLRVESKALEPDSSPRNTATVAPPPANSSWVFSSTSVDAQNDDNRRWWTSYVVAAAEAERQRRIKLNDEEIDEEANERYERQEWARRAIEAEQQRIIQEYEHNHRHDTVKHIDEESQYKTDYIVVCPNVSKGCTYEGHLRDIELHLLECEFHARDDVVTKDMGDAESNSGQDDYGVIMCPYSYFGCTHCALKDELEAHIKVCEYRGKTREDEELDRRNSILDAIQATEEEQQRRVEERHNEAITLGISNLATPFTALQQIMERQTKMLQKHLGKEILRFSRTCGEVYLQNKIHCCEIIARISRILKKISGNAVIGTYGSYSTGLSIPSSDLDLFVQDDNGTDNADILVALANAFRRNEEKYWIKNVHIITTAIVPVLKFDAHLRHKKSNGSDKMADKSTFSIAVDITLGNKNHTGIATAAFVQKMISLMPHLKPITLVLKACFSKSNLNDTFTGGIPSYGIFLVVLSIVLHLQQVELSGSEKSEIEIDENQIDDTYKSSIYETENADNVVEIGLIAPSSPGKNGRKQLLSPKLTSHANDVDSKKELGIKLAVDICKNVQHIHEINFPSSVRTRRRSRNRLKHNHDEVVDEEEQGEENERDIIALGRLFMHILHFLGQTFEPSRDHISILHGGIFPRKDVSGHSVSDPLLLEDPLAPKNNVGRRCYRISEIQTKCWNALSKLYQILNRFEIRRKRSSSVTSSVLESVFKTFTVEKVDLGSSTKSQAPVPESTLS